jgi:conflict system STAND superfamily ATPase/WD40 domain-containing protein
MRSQLRLLRHRVNNVNLQNIWRESLHAPAQSEITQSVGAQGLFSRLVRVAKPDEAGEDTRQRTELSEADTLAKRVAKRLADARLLVTGGEAGTGTISVEVAHEVLIRNWERLRGWLNEDREFLLWRQRLIGLLAEWEHAEESDETLLRGSLLIEAQKWFDQRSQDLSDQERKFISASREERERLTREEKERQERELEAARKLADAQKERAEQAEKAQRLEEERTKEAEKYAREQERAARAEAERAAEAERVQRLEAERAKEAEKRAKEQKEAASKLRRWAIGAASAAAAVVILLAVSVVMWRAAQEQARIANDQRTAAQEQAQIAETRRLAAESFAALANHPVRSLLLAVEAVRREKSLHGFRPAAAEQSLRDAFGSIGGRPIAQSETMGISHDNHWLLTVSSDHTARLWDLTAKDPLANPVVLRGHEGSVIAWAISPDNHWLVMGSADFTARLWDLTVKDPSANPTVLRGHEDSVEAVAISPDNRWLVTGSSDHTARLWDLTAKDPSANPAVLRGHEGAVLAVAISLDSHRLTTGSSDHAARLWDLTAKDPSNLLVLRGHEGYVGAVAISPNNHWLVTGSSDKTARLWLLQVNDLIDLARAKAGRNFTADEWQLYFSGEKYRKTFPDLPGPDLSRKITIFAVPCLIWRGFGIENSSTQRGAGAARPSIHTLQS